MLVSREDAEDYSTLRDRIVRFSREEGFRFLLAPKPGGGISWSRMSFKSLCGEVSLSWELVDRELRLEAVVPPNTEAVLDLGDLRPPERLGSGRRRIVVELGPGD